MAPNEQPTSVVALVTARGSSTLRDKHFASVLGRPLIHYPAMAALNAKTVDAHFVSSDDGKIRTHLASLGYRTVQRPRGLATDKTQHVDVIRHAIACMKREQITPGILVVVLGNNAAIKSVWIDDCVEALLADPLATCVAPVYCDQNHHPYRAKTIYRRAYLDPIVHMPRGVSTNRQDLPPSMFFCHNFWVLRLRHGALAKRGQPPWTFMGNRIRPFLVEASADVHKAEDIFAAECWLRQNGWKTQRAPRRLS